MRILQSKPVGSLMILHTGIRPVEKSVRKDICTESSVLPTGRDSLVANLETVFPAGPMLLAVLDKFELNAFSARNDGTS